MVRYRIREQEVENALKDPDEVIKGREVDEKQRWVAHKLLDNKRLLRVIYEKDEENIIVVTTYISKREKYYMGGIYEDKI